MAHSNLKQLDLKLLEWSIVFFPNKFWH